jgi:hypothetical protein
MSRGTTTSHTSSTSTAAAAAATTTTATGGATATATITTAAAATHNGKGAAPAMQTRDATANTSGNLNCRPRHAVSHRESHYRIRFMTGFVDTDRGQPPRRQRDCRKQQRSTSFPRASVTSASKRGTADSGNGSNNTPANN